MIVCAHNDPQISKSYVLGLICRSTIIRANCGLDTCLFPNDNIRKYLLAMMHGSTETRFEASITWKT
jgi:hypothetical protein